MDLSINIQRHDNLMYLINTIFKELPKCSDSSVLMENIKVIVDCYHHSAVDIVLARIQNGWRMFRYLFLLLTYYTPVLLINTPENRKPKGFLLFSWSIDRQRRPVIAHWRKR